MRATAEILAKLISKACYFSAFQLAVRNEMFGAPLEKVEVSADRGYSSSRIVQSTDQYKLSVCASFYSSTQFLVGHGVVRDSQRIRRATGTK